MSGVASDAEPVGGFADLVDYLASGCRPQEQWRIGAEHEKLGFLLDGHGPLPYEGPAGVRAMLEGMQRFGWLPVMEGGRIVGLEMPGNRGAVSLEPGGQFELSGAMLETLHQTCDEVHAHLAQVRTVAGEVGAGFLGVGFAPTWPLADMPVMPKRRYEIMARYMRTRGRLGLDMMFRSCTVQVNLDFACEADMVKKLRVALALQPMATAIFANSPFVGGAPSGYLSYRGHVWTGVDPDRTGMLPFVFEEGFGFERYADYALDVPMYFVYRNGRYVDVSGQSFRDFMAGRLPGLPGETPTRGDWLNHLTTIFPEARLKRFIEMRGADGGPWRRLCALPALWVGLLYHGPSLDAAFDMVSDWTPDERQALRRDVQRTALATPFRGGVVRGLAEQMVELARAGLRARAHLDAAGNDETIFLKEADRIVSSGRAPAEGLLEAYHGRWNRSVDPIFTEHAY